MDLRVIAAASMLSGLAVVAATALARRLPAPWAGLAAAFPVTPAADDG